MPTNKSHHYKSKLKQKTKFNLPILLIVVGILAVIGIYLVIKSFAASGTLSAMPATSSPSLGSTFAVTIRANSGTDLVNAVQADLTYPTSQLEFVSIDASTSAYGVQAVSTGGNGVVNITRGTTTPISGDNIVAVVNFKAIGLGAATVAFSNSSALLKSSDNTNILVSKASGTYTVVDSTAPSVPTGLTSPSKTVSSVNLSWAASTDNVGVTGYKIYRNGTQIGTSATTTYSATGLAPNTSYSFAVAAYDASGNTSALSTASNFSTLPDTTPPSVPTGLSSPSKTVTSINLSWTASTDDVGVTGYKIYRNGTQVGTSATTTYSSTGLTPNTSYSFTVAAYDAIGNTSAQSAASSFSTLADTTAPSVPTGLNMSSQTGFNVGLSWTASTDNVAVTGYKIYRNGTQIATSATTTYTNTVAAAGTYSYTVAAYDAAGNTSAQTAAISATVYNNGDINHDGAINIYDLSILLSNYNQTGTNQADLNSDNVVNIYDLSILLSNYTG